MSALLSPTNSVIPPSLLRIGVKKSGKYNCICATCCSAVISPGTLITLRRKANVSCGWAMMQLIVLLQFLLAAASFCDRSV